MESQQRDDATFQEEMIDPLDPQMRIRKRDYAVEISRIMGRQLVAAMNSGMRKNSAQTTDGKGGSEEGGESVL